MKDKKVEIFCGTGGVGKTTLSTSRALYLSSNKKVLLITIDPSKRLKDLFNIKDKDSGKIINTANSDNELKNSNLDILLMNPVHTFSRIGSTDALNNNIIKTITSSYGGMHEIMSIIEIQYQLDNNNYDCIVLDTPPGKHFIDFLQSTDKINEFFNKTNIDLIKKINIGELSIPNKLTVLFKPIIGKLISYLKHLTDSNFIEEFLQALSIVHKNKSFFMDALKFQDLLIKEDSLNWFLVTSAEHQKYEENIKLHKSISNIIYGNQYLAINKSLHKYLNQWDVSNNDPILYKLKQTMIKREESIKDNASKNFKNLIQFSEILKKDPKQQVIGLKSQWASI